MTVAGLEFLAELVLVDADEDVANLILGRVDVDEIVGLEVAIGVIDFSVSASVRSTAAVPANP